MHLCVFKLFAFHYNWNADKPRVWFLRKYYIYWWYFKELCLKDSNRRPLAYFCPLSRWKKYNSWNQRFEPVKTCFSVKLSCSLLEKIVCKVRKWPFLAMVTLWCTGTVSLTFGVLFLTRNLNCSIKEWQMAKVKCWIISSILREIHFLFR